jgi:hypothetical protein
MTVLSPASAAGLSIDVLPSSAAIIYLNQSRLIRSAGKRIKILINLIGYIEISVFSDACFATCTGPVLLYTLNFSPTPKVIPPTIQAIAIH